MNREEAITLLSQNKAAAKAMAEITPMSLKDIEAFDMAIEALKAQKWIPCSEGFPDTSGYYLVTLDYKEVDYVWYHAGKYPGWDRIYTEDGNNIIAWMPLPEPYRKEQNNE